jgi:PAS domain S-box-containing protein
MLVSNLLIGQTVYKKKQYTRIDGLASEFIYDISIGPRGKLWVATDEGISVFNGEYFRNYTTQNSGLRDDYIKQLVVSDTSIYVLYANNEVSKHLLNDSLTTFEYPSKVSVEYVNVVKHNPNNYKLPLTKKAELLTYLDLIDKEVRVWFTDREASYWIGTKGSGLIHIQDEGIRVIDTAYNGGNIIQFQRNCLYANNGQLSLLGEEQLVSLTPQPLSDAVIGVYTHEYDTVIVGNKGIYDWKSFNLSIPIHDITTATRYGDTLVVGTLNRGVFYILNDSIIKKYGLSDGIAHPKINDLIVHDNSLWVATASGISLIEKGEVKIIENTEVYDWKKIIRVKDNLYAFTLQGGGFKIGAKECLFTLDYENQVYEGVYAYQGNCVIVFTQGIYYWDLKSIRKMNIPYDQGYEALFVCGDSLFVSHDKQLFKVALQEKKCRPKVEVISTKINGKKQPNTNKAYQLKFGKYDIQLELSPILLDIDKKMVYSYRINDGDWTSLSESKTIVLAGVSQSFSLEIYAAVQGHEAIQSERILKTFNIDVPFWKKPINRLIVGGLFIVLIVFVFTIRNRAIQARNKELSRLVKEKTAKIEADQQVIVKKNQELSVLKRAIDDTSNPLVVFNERGNCIYHNHAFEKSFTISRELSIPQFFDLEKKMFEKSLEEETYTCERMVISKQGQAEYFLLTITKLEKANQYLELYILVAQSINERKEIENSLLLARDNAIKSQKAKEITLSTINHEIRNPVNAIVGASQLLSNELGLNEQQKDLTTMLKNSAHSLLNLVNNGLFLGKQEAGLITFDNQPFSVLKTIEDTVSMLNYQARNKENILQVNYLLKHDCYTGDPLRLKQVLLNLMSNAIKFTIKGKIVLKVEEIKGSLMFSIQDNGVGIKEEHLPQLFKQYTQFEDGHHVKSEGTGLGMFICKSIIEEQGGQIQADSKYGEGTTITFSLPYIKTNEEKLPQEQIQSKSKDCLAHLSVLVVEDDLFNQLYLSRLLKEHKIQLKLCTNIEAAMQQIKQENFDIVLTDMELPDGTGVDVAQQMKEKGYKVPIIVITACEYNQVKDGLTAHLFQGYIQKPFLPQSLLKAIQKVLDGKEKKCEENKIIDRAKIERIIGHDSALFKMLAESFYNDFPNVLQCLNRFVNDGDVQSFRRKSHVLKSTMGYFALEKQMKILDEILGDLKKKNKEIAKEKLVIFEREMGTVMTEIEENITKEE